MPLIFKTPVPVGPPQPTADTYDFDSLTIDAVTGDIVATQHIYQSQPPDKNGNPQPRISVATGTVICSKADAVTILGAAAFGDLYTKLKAALHQIAQAKGQEPTGGTLS